MGEHEYAGPSIEEQTERMRAMIFDRPKSLSVSEDGEVKSGSMEYLTRYVISQSLDAPACTEAFVLTYRQFGATPGEIMKYVETFFKKYVETFFKKPDNTTPKVKHKKGDKPQETLPPPLPILTERIVQFFKLWINVAYHADFQQAGLLPILLDFLKNKIHPIDARDGTTNAYQVKLVLLRANDNYHK